MFFFNPSSVPQQFEECYQCYSMAVSGRDLEDGDKILLPQSALEILARSCHISLSSFSFHLSLSFHSLS
jgi:hypothetical protein